MFDAAVEPACRGTDATHDLLGEPRRLLSHCVAKLGAGGDLPQSCSSLRSGDLVGELERAWARQRRIEEPFQLTARSELVDDAFEHAVADNRARDLLGQRSGERTVDDAGDLGSRKNLVHRLLELVPPGSRGGSRREQGGAPGCVGQP